MSKTLSQVLADKAIREEEKQSRGERLLELAEQMVTALTLVAADDDEGIALYTCSDDDVIAPFSNRELESAIFVSYPTLVKNERDEVAAFVKQLVLAGSPVDLATVQPVAFADEKTLTWNRLPFTRDSLASVQLSELKAFNHLLSLCDDPQALVLWIGSLLDPQAGRSQYLHLHGGGGNGKSTLFNSIGNVIGSRHVVTTRADEFSNQHWGSILESARLLIFPDENNPGFFGTGKFKEFTGEEQTTVNPKYEKPRRIRLTHKTAVFSNNRVEISSSVADRRRLLSVSMADDPDGNIGFRWWYDELKSSGERILGYCYHEYLKAVAADPSVRAFISQQARATEEAVDRKYQDIMDVACSLFKFTGSPADKLPASDVLSAIVTELRERRTNRLLMQQVREALKLLGAVEVGRRPSYYSGVREVGGFSAATMPRIVK